MKNAEPSPRAIPPSPAMWQSRLARILLLLVLAYETLGCFSGGALLVAAPDGRYMDMPVELMRGFFPDFRAPGLFLLFLGALNLSAFLAVLKRISYDWFLAGLALGGLFVWFVVEIIVLQELHWLHLMWGIPVMWGWVAAIQLIAARHDSLVTQRTLLVCGICSGFWLLALNVYVPLYYEGYSMATYTVSELSAIGAPTQILWVLLSLPHPLLYAALAWGVRRSFGDQRNLRITADLMLASTLFSLFWPPMHQREILAAGGGTLTDTLHIVWTVLALLFMLLIMGFGSASLGKSFRFYTIGTWVVFIVFGVLTFLESPGIESNLPTPHIGIWERINILAYQLWVIVFARVLLRRKGK